jgi:predicted acyl esterase
VLALSPQYEDRFLRTATTADLDDPFWKDSGKSDEELILEWKDIPICFLSGWYGNHLTANVDKFRILTERAEGPTRLIVGHWEHNMLATFAGGVDFGGNATMDIFGDRRVEWFDQTLKGINTGVLDRPVIEYFVMGGGDGKVNADGRLNHGGRWEAADSWPPANVETVPYYLHADITLRLSVPDAADASTTYTFDPRDPVPTVGGNFMEYTRPDFASRVTWMADGAAQDQRANATKPFCRDDLPLATREDVLVFQTEPLEEDVEVSGELLARLWVSSTAPDTDFTVKLIDVHPPSPSFPEGFAMNLQDAVVRMRYRNGRRKPELITPGEIYEIELPFHSTSNLFKAGHRIRFDVSSSNFPRIDVNPNTGGPLGFPGPVHTADNTIHHDADHPSHVILPVVERP